MLAAAALRADGSTMLAAAALRADGSTPRKVTTPARCPVGSFCD